MSTSAIVMMIVMLGTIWGGLAVSFVHLLKHPDETSGELGEVAGQKGAPGPARTAGH